MAAVIKIPIGKDKVVWARVRDGEWGSDDRDLVDFLSNAVTHGLWGPGGDDPNPDLTLARKAVDLLGGEVVEHEKDAMPPDTVF